MAFGAATKRVCIDQRSWRVQRSSSVLESTMDVTMARMQDHDVKLKSICPTGCVATLAGMTGSVKRP